MNDNEAEAKKRFFILSLLRLGGAVFLALGLLIIAGKIDMQKELGIPFVLIGFADFLIMPWWLAKRWKTPDA